MLAEDLKSELAYTQSAQRIFPGSIRSQRNTPKSADILQFVHRRWSFWRLLMLWWDLCSEYRQILSRRWRMHLHALCALVTVRRLLTWRVDQTVSGVGGKSCFVSQRTRSASRRARQVTDMLCSSIDIWRRVPMLR